MAYGELSKTDVSKTYVFLGLSALIRLTPSFRGYWPLSMYIIPYNIFLINFIRATLKQIKITEELAAMQDQSSQPEN